MEIFNRRHWRQQQARAAHRTPSDKKPLLALGAEFLLERLADVRRQFPVVLELGARSQHLQASLAPQTELYVAAQSLNFSFQNSALPVVADEELLPFAPGSFDLVISNLALHSVNDVPGTLKQIYHVLKPGGLFQGALLGGETLMELRQSLLVAEQTLTGGASPRVAPMVDLASASQLLQRAAFALPVVDSEQVEFAFADLPGLMRFLRVQGETNCLAERQKNLSTRRLFHYADTIYRNQYPATHAGQIKASFGYIFLHGWKSE